MAEKVLADISPGRQVVKSKLPDPMLRNIFFFRRALCASETSADFLGGSQIVKSSVRFGWVDSGHFLFAFFPGIKQIVFQIAVRLWPWNGQHLKEGLSYPKKDCAIAGFSFSQILDTIARHQKLPKLFVLCSNTQRCF